MLQYPPMTEPLSHDLLIIGGGAAGLRAAIAAVELEESLNIAVVSKVYPMRSHTVSAEGGAAAVLREEDNLELHGFDTVRGSDFLADQDAVETFVERAPQEIIQLEHWGCPWSRDENGKISVRAFGGMSVKRTVFASDKTGFHMLHALFQTSLKYTEITRYDEWFVSSLLIEEGQCVGAMALDLRTGQVQPIVAKAVLLCTGGCGRIFPFTTNGSIKTGDGMALAYRAGAPLKDMEFVQYHPTGLPGTGILITEASRGEGGHLFNKEGERFLEHYIPGKMELGPRDILSRAIVTEMQQGRAFEGPFGQYVHLDLQHLGEKVINEKLPFVRELTVKYVGIDPVHEPIPVRPVVHYMMGGVSTDIDGNTPVAGLFAAGEAACITINGANRLGSNSLTECLVFGALSGRAAAQHALEQKPVPANPVNLLAEEERKRIAEKFLQKEGGTEQVSSLREEMNLTMEKNCGVYRAQEGLKEACTVLRKLRERFENIAIEDRGSVFNTDLTAALELDFMLDVAECIAHSALAREESRGAQSRLDFPERNDEKFLYHHLAYTTPEGPRLEQQSVKITHWPPQERKY
ncbi:FAD-binding protein [Acidobacteria bacterium AH-259-D05]|nr:FAD-binding protein [Acidobacteria bacterium AH-259-D05]